MMWWEVGAAEALAVVAAVRGAWSPCGLSMISAINPLSERARGHRFWLTAAWFVLGAIAGGALLGGAMAIFAGGLHPVQDQRAVILAAAVAACLVTLAGDLRLRGFSLPIHPRQVNERWLGRYRRWVYASGFGVQLGSGFSTYIMTTATYLFVLLGVLSAQPGAAFLVGVSYGLVRGLPVLIIAPVRDPHALRRLHRRLDSLEPWSLHASVATQAAVALLLAYLWVGWAGPVALAVVVSAIVVGPTRRLVAATGSDPTPVAGSGTA